MRVTAKGLGEHDHDVELGKLNLVIGPNGSGKSKLLEAIRLAALGYSPTYGKRPADVAQMMRGDRLSVRLELEDGRTIDRAIKASGKGYSASCQVGWLDARKAGGDEHRAAAQALFGASEDEVAESMNVRSLTHATESARNSRIQQMLESTFDVRRALKTFGRYVTLRLANRVDDPPENHLTLRSAIQGYDEDGEHSGQYQLLRECVPKVEEALKELGVGGAIDWAKGKKLEAQSDTRRLRAATDVAESRALQLPQVSATELAELESSRESLDRQFGGIEERLVDIRRTMHRVSEAEKLLARKQGELEAAKTARAEYEDATLGEDEKRERIDAIEAEIAELKTRAKEEPVPDVADLEAELARATAAAEAVEIPPAVSVEVCRARLASVEAAVAESPWAYVAEISAKIHEAVFEAKVPKAVRAEVTELTERLHNLAEDHGGTGHGAIADARIALAQAEVAQGSYEKAIAEVAEIDKRRGEIRAEIAAKRSAHDERTKDLRDAIHALVEERDGLRTAIADTGAADVRTKSAVERAEADVESARRRVLEIRGDEHDDPAALEAQQDPIREQLSEVKSRLRTLTDARAKRDDVDKLRLDLLRAEDDQTVYAAAEWALVRVRGDEINESGGKLTRVMREFFVAGGREETPIIQADMLGWAKPGGNPVSVKAISDGQFALFSTALVAALLIAQGAEVRALLVEADNADDEHLPALLAGIEAVSDRLTVAIVSRWAHPQHVSDEWSVIEFGADGKVSVAA